MVEESGINNMSNYIRKTPRKEQNSDKNWSKKEDEFLIENYHTLGSKAVAELLHRVPAACRNRAYHLNITRVLGWSLEEEQILVQNYANKGAGWVAKQLGRSKSCCIARAGKLGIKRDYHWTKTQTDYLKKYYPIVGAVGVASFLNRSPNTCQVKASSLGIQYVDQLKWSKEDEQLLTEHYPREGVIAVAKLIGKSESACRSHAATMGLIFDNSWTKEEENIIKEYYPRFGPSGISVLLNRTHSACVSRASKLGIIFENTLKWTKEETGILRQYYPLEGAKVAERINGRSASACMNCAGRLGISYKQTESMGVHVIKKFLDYKGIRYQQEVVFENCKYKNKLRFDFAIFLVEQDFPDKPTGLIEFDGLQHFRPVHFFDFQEYKYESALQNLRLRDEIKNNFCQQFCIPLLRIRYNQGEQINEILSDFIAHLETYLISFNPFLSNEEYYEGDEDASTAIVQHENAKNISKLQTKGAFYSFRWTKDECTFLRDNYSYKDAMWIANRLGRTCSACENKARKLKLKRRSPNCYHYRCAWSVVEDNLLKVYYEEKGAQWVADQIGRTVSACQHRASRMQVKKKKHFTRWTKEEDDILIKFHKKKTHQDIAQVLMRTKQACDNRVRILKIKKKIS